MSRPNFDALRDLHNLANDLLHSPIIKRALIHRQQEKWVDEVSEASLRMLDVCGTTKDALLLVKDHLQELQSTFRGISVGETAAVNKFAAHFLHRKKLKKEILKSLVSLKGMKNNYVIITSDLSPIDHNLVLVVNVIREVRVTTMSIAESLLMTLTSIPSPILKSNKWYFTSKFMRVSSPSLSEKQDRKALFQSAKKRLEAVGIVIENLEVELDCIFKRLIRTRVSLLNILTN